MAGHALTFDDISNYQGLRKRGEQCQGDSIIRQTVSHEDGRQISCPADHAFRAGDNRDRQSAVQGFLADVPAFDVEIDQVSTLPSQKSFG